MADRGGRVLVWDLPTRLFHWGLALCFAGSWITAEAGFEWTQTHFYFGYATLGLLTFRILWGLLGPRYARFSSFPIAPARVWPAVKTLFSARAGDYAGHNPLGSLAVIALLLLMASQATSGLFISDDIAWSGPYNGAVSSDMAGQLAGWHHTNFSLLQGMVALHLLAMLWYHFRKKENLVGPMITGRKVTEHAAATNDWPKALLVIVLSALAVWALLYFAPPPAPVSYF